MEWLAGIAATVIAALIVAWLSGFLKRFVPSPKRSLLAARNILRTNSRSSGDRFRFVLCWLEDDADGEGTAIVAQAFTGIRGVDLVRSARIVEASGAADEWRPAMQANARAVLDKWNADLAVVGLVKKPGETFSLWFVPRSGDGTLGRGDRPYKLEDATLGPDFHDDLRAELAALALAAVAPLADTETRGRVLGEGLTEATDKLTALLQSSAIDEPERRAALRFALGSALAALGERESETVRLEEGSGGLPHGAGGLSPRMRPASMGRNAEQPRQRPCGPGRAGERHQTSRRGRGGLPRVSGRIHPRARAAQLGRNAEQPRQRPGELG